MKQTIRIGIIGASASGIYTAILCAAKNTGNKAFEITLFDHADKLAKKIYATGNGHCNLLHDPFLSSAYNHPEFVQSLLDQVKKSPLDLLHEMGVLTTKKGELIYPLSYSAASYVAYLSAWLGLLPNVEIRLSENVLDVDGGTVKTNQGRYQFDRVVFAFGGQSQSALGSDGSMFSVLQSKGYKVTKRKPALVALRCPEIPNYLAGSRHGAHVRLVRKGECIYEETGEVIFRRGGISGICVMNASAYFQKGDDLYLDLFPEYDPDELSAMLSSVPSYVLNDCAYAALDKNLARFVSETCHTKSTLGLAMGMKMMVLKPTDTYGFEESQVTSGGIDLSQVNASLQSTIDPRHYFVGECLDIHGLCGGHNLGFALLSAMVVAGALS